MVIEAPPLIRGLAEGAVMVGTISSVALNIEGYPFTRHATKEQQHEMIEPLCDALGQISKVRWDDPLVLYELGEEHRQILREMEYIPGEKDDITDYTLLVIGKSLTTLALINGEEHLYVERYLSTEKPEEIEKALARAHTIADNMYGGMVEEPAWRDNYRFLMQNPACSGDEVSVGAWMNLTALVETGRMWYIQEMAEMTGMKIRAAMAMETEDGPGFFRIEVPRDSFLRISTAAGRLHNLCKLLSDKEIKMREMLVKDTKTALVWKEKLHADFERIHARDDIGEHEIPGITSRLVLGIALRNYRLGIAPKRAGLVLKRMFQQILPTRMRQIMRGNEQIGSTDKARGVLLNICIEERLKAQLI